MEVTRGEKLDALVQLMLLAEKRATKLHYGKSFQITDKHAVAKALIDGTFSITEAATAIAEYYDALDNSGTSAYPLWHGRLGFWRKAYVDGRLNVQYAIATRVVVPEEPTAQEQVEEAVEKALRAGVQLDDLISFAHTVVRQIESEKRVNERKRLEELLRENGLTLEAAKDLLA